MRTDADPIRTSAAALPEPLRDRILERLGFGAPPPADRDGLFRLYAAWCAGVPFDNLRKMIALLAREPGPLPGGEAVDFYAGWLADGAGGTCWSGSNALWALLRSVGFDARRCVGSMRDTGALTHGTVKVMLEGRAWLVDSSMLTLVPIALGEGTTRRADPVLPVEVERAGAEEVVWFDAPGSPPIPCRLLVDDPTDAMVHERYEASRTKSPFNDRVYVRRHARGRAMVLVGNERTERTAAGQTSRPLDAHELRSLLTGELGYSERLVARWESLGGLTASLQPPAAPPWTSSMLPPSRR